MNKLNFITILVHFFCTYGLFDGYTFFNLAPIFVSVFPHHNVGARLDLIFSPMK